LRKSGCPVFLLLNAFEQLFSFFRIIPKVGRVAFFFFFFDGFYLSIYVKETSSGSRFFPLNLLIAQRS
jgi:hypothetical protein